MTTKTEAERKKLLSSLGLSDKGDTLAPAPTMSPTPEQATLDGIVLAPPGVDPRAMPVDEIAFDPRLLDRFTSLEKDGMNQAAQFVFGLYKSHVKGDRNKALWPKVTQFITAERRRRKTGGIVTENIKTTAEQRDLAQLIAAAGITAEDLAKIIKEQA
jgi:hypothetical protein